MKQGREQRLNSAQRFLLTQQSAVIMLPKDPEAQGTFTARFMESFL